MKMFPDLNLPAYPLRIQRQGEAFDVFDPARKKFVSLTPEEWVRQHVLMYLNRDRGCPLTLMSIEGQIVVNGQPKRYDMAVFRNNGSPLLVVECKAPEVEITQNVFDQIAVYNMQLGASFLLVSNGLTHHCCRMDHAARAFRFLDAVPSYEEMIQSQNE
ncbi:MAG: type I restriction enzyme HsdR N-terminal domain-containing protein [Bacteroidetes bacterium]|nr:type I restriction enzyme HsdR N-terminal domain-containing protein [Bacteroidota bacterium]